MAEPACLYAVLTGDLVRSSRLAPSQSRGAMVWLRQAADEFARAYPGATVGRMDSFRHDSWQWLLCRPGLAVRAAVFMRACLRMRSSAGASYDTRVAIGIGTIEVVAKRRVSDSRGPAFAASGQTLDAMQRERLALTPADQLAVTAACLGHGMVPLLDCIVDDWTPAEARAVRGALMGWTQQQTASSWRADGATHRNPTRQAVAKALDRAHWRALSRVLDWVEA